ncbi:MAG TPA: XrtA system polysaccharide deacetylase [Candidatus Binatia bacterium]|nr:XrtA system polysaccharide deacetylase [Candidatus Binatia bacterium]
MLNALTVDVEEYFQVEAFRGRVPERDWTHLPSRVAASTRRLLDLFDRHQVRATFFVVGWVARRHPDLVREIAARGHEVGCHSDAHRPIYALGPDGFRRDLRAARAALEDAAGTAVAGYRAPTCSVVRTTWWALDILVEEGFRYDSSVFPIHHDRYGIPDAPRFPYRVRLDSGAEIVEFPMSTFRVAGQNLPFAGGGYFRLLPYPLVRRAIGHLNRREERPAMVYVHPWEVDPEQPRLPAGPLTRFRHYVNLDRTEAKLDRLLADFAFAPAARVLAALGFAEVAA